MGIRHLKLLIIALAMGFATQACVLWVHDYDHHYRFHHWDRHSSLQQSDRSIAPMTAQNNGDSGRHEQVAR